MATVKTCLTLLLLASASAALAETTPASLLSGYAAEAARAVPGFAPSAERGQSFLAREWGVSQKMASCATCHGASLKSDGKHVITDKRIAPLAPAANPERFTSLPKVEKWFKRNCTEVVGRECTAAEKADFIQYVTQGG